MEHPKVSVIMPVYKGAAYLPTAVASVAAQTVPLELIVIDDCSPDTSAAVAKDCGAQYPHLHLRLLQNKQNLGVAASRNAGVAVAQGEFVAFLDCDDWWEPTKLALQLARLEKTGRPLCCTARALVEEDGTPTGKIVPVAETITREALLQFNSIALSSALLRTDLAKKFPMSHDDCHEDYLMWLEILKEYPAADGLNLPLLKYRKSPGAKTSSKVKSARMHYRSLRRAGVSAPKAALLFCFYALHGLQVHGRSKGQPRV